MRKHALEKTNVPPLTCLMDDEQRFQEKVSAFAQEYVAPLSLEMDRNARLDDALIQRLFEEGLMGIEIPSDYGGQNENFFKTMLAIEALSHVDPGIAVFVDVHNTLVISAINRWGSPEQKKRLLPLLARSVVGAFSISEEQAGSDAYAMTCRADKVDHGYVLTGRKKWVTNAAEADLFLVFANTHPEFAKEGLTAFLIDKNQTTAMKIEPPEEKLGIRASSTCGLILEGVMVPDENMLGEVGQGGQVAIETLTVGRIGIAAQMLGLAEGALEAAIAYAGRRKQFNRPIAKYQGVHFPIAEMATKVEAARLLVYNAARISDMQDDSMSAFTSASMAKLYASQVAESVASQSLEIFGGNGYMKGNTIEKLYRDAIIGKIYEGTSNMQKSTIAKTIMKI